MLTDATIEIIDECRRCGREPAKGETIVRDGIRIFRCDECGKNMHIGFVEEIHDKQRRTVMNKEHAEENRDRFWREMNEKQRQDFGNRIENLDPDAHTAYSIDHMVKPLKFGE